MIALSQVMKWYAQVRHPERGGLWFERGLPDSGACTLFFFFSIKLSLFVFPASWACGVLSPVGLGILFWTSQALEWRDAGCSLQADSGRSLPPRLSPRWEGGVQEDPHHQLPVQVLPGSVTDFEGNGKWNWPHICFPRPGGLWECPEQKKQQPLPNSYQIE